MVVSIIVQVEFTYTLIFHLTIESVHDLISLTKKQLVKPFT